MTGAALASGGLVVAVNLVTTPGAGAVSPWSTPAPLSTVLFTSVSCANPSFCWAVDIDGRAFFYNGASWTPPYHAPPVRIDPGSLAAVSCPSFADPIQAFCGAVGSAGSALIYTAQSGWGGVETIDNGNALSSVSCGLPDFCVAVDGAGNVIFYNGPQQVGWGTPTHIDTSGYPFNGLDGVSCPSITFCAAVGSHGDFYLYDGTSWSSSTISGVGGLSGVSCTSSQFCAAVDDAGNVVLYDGTSWTSRSIDPGHNLASISCATNTSCTAGDDAGSAFIYTGATWTPFLDIDTTLPGQLDGMSCPTAVFCVGVDFSGNVVIYNGRVQIKGPSLLPAVRGAPYRPIQLQVVGNSTPVTWKHIGTLPKGIRLHSDGTLSGTPKVTDTPGTYTFTAEVKTKRSIGQPAQSNMQLMTMTLN
jgi:hypothetical protein